MIKIEVKSKEVTEGYKITTLTEGEASLKECKMVINAILNSFTESVGEEVVITALEEYAKERLDIR